MRWWNDKKRDSRNRPNIQSTYALPTVKFDSSRISETIKVDLKRNIESLNEIDGTSFDMIYDAALQSICTGRALNILYDALMKIKDMSKRRAQNIALTLNNKATTLIQAEDQQRSGIKYATWIYSGAPCGTFDSAHKLVNGKPYAVNKGMLLNGRWTLPGYEEGCKCYSKSMIIGFDGYKGGKPEGIIE